MFRSLTYWHRNCVFLYQILEHNRHVPILCIFSRTKNSITTDSYIPIYSALRLVHSDLRIYLISFFLLDLLCLRYMLLSQQTRHIRSLLDQSWASRVDGEPALIRQWVSDSCCLGCTPLQERKTRRCLQFRHRQTVFMPVCYGKIHLHNKSGVFLQAKHHISWKRAVIFTIPV